MKNIPLTKKERIAIIAGIGFLIVGYFAYQSFAGTTVGLSLQQIGIFPGTNINSGMVSHWTFDSGSMIQNVTDSSGQGNTGYLTGFNSTTTVPGTIGQALQFNGTSQAVKTSLSAALTSAFTISVWINATLENGSSIPEMILGKWDDDGNNRQFFLSLGSEGVCSSLQNNKIYVFLDSAGSFNCGTVSQSFSGTTVISLNKWYHVVVTYDSTTAKIYVNGNLDNSQAFTGPLFNSAANVLLGGYDGSGNGLNAGPDSRWFPGSLDDTRVYNRVLSAAEVTRLYSLGSGAHPGTSIQTTAAPGNTNINSGLIGYWTFDGKDSIQNIADLSGQGNSGRLAGFTSTSTVPGKIGEALSFPGTLALVDTRDFTVEGTDLTMAAWVRPIDFIQPRTILAKFDANSVTTSAFLFRFEIGGALAFTTRDASTQTTTRSVVVAPFTASTSAKWAHVAVVYNFSSGLATFYVNGAAIGKTDSNVLSQIQNTANSVRIGKRGPNDAANPNPFYGSMDDVRLYNRALSPADITALYSMGNGTTLGTSVQTGSATGNSLSTGLVGYWTFDGKNSIQNIGDSSGQGNTGYLTGFTSTTSVPGKIGQALLFTGGAATNEVRVPDAASLDPSAITISTWIYSTGSDPSATSERIVDKANSGTISQNGFRMQAFSAASCGTASAEWGFQWYNGSGQLLCGPTIPSTTNKWTHIVFTHDGTTGRIYTNGVLTNSLVASYTGSNSFNLVIGNSDQVNRPFTGKIDDVRMYNRALSASEVARLYQLGK